MNKNYVLGIILIMTLFISGCVSKNASQNISENNYRIEFENDFEIRLINNGTEIQIIEYRGSKSDVNIPSEIKGLPVTSIGSGAFVGGLTSINIPNSIKIIEYRAFPVNNFTSVIIPDSVTFIGDQAFYMSSLLNSVIIGNNVKHIGNNAFQFNQLNSITIGANVTLGDDSFDNGFEYEYNNNGKQAGTYVLVGLPLYSSNWKKQ
jgi:hypothetical protein